MKKFLAILMVICMMASLLCVPAFAAESADKLPEPAAGTLLRITAIKGDAIELVGDHKSFEDGWNAAMNLAGEKSEMASKGYDRVVVDVYADWNAVNGNFTDDAWWETNGPGFDNDTIYIPDDAKVTLNLNGHTINRGLTHVHSDGEVIYVNDDANLIINDGTIKGGYSENGAGGIHIKDGAKVTLNNVHIVGNRSIEDDGAGISIEQATLTMNGGSLKDNFLYDGNGGAIYAEDSTVALNNVEIQNNQTATSSTNGAAIYAKDSKVLMTECTVKENGTKDEAKELSAATSIIYGVDSSIVIKKSTFVDNGDLTYQEIKQTVNRSYVTNVSSLFTLNETTLTIENGCEFSKNATGYLIYSINDSAFFISDSTFANNESNVLCSGDHLDDSYFQGCTFLNNRAPYIKGVATIAYTFNVTENVITFYNCNLGNSTFDKDDADYIKREYATVSESEAAICVSALLADGTTAFSNYYKDFKNGWNAAIENVLTGSYDRIVVDLYADWTADDKGEFSDDFIDGVGFEWNTIAIPANARITINMNGHTINRALDDEEEDGEVICIYKNADVIINDGTIKGGNSSTGAGGIHIKDDAKVTLNDVHVIGNRVVRDDGGGIAVYDGATLIMNGGSISDNVAVSNYVTTSYGVGLFTDNSTVVLNNVTISNNQSEGTYECMGAAIYARNSEVTLNECQVNGNGIEDKTKDFTGAYSIVYIDRNSIFTANDTTFANNGAHEQIFKAQINAGEGGGGLYTPDAMIDVDNGACYLNNCTLTENKSVHLIESDGGDVYVSDTTVTKNNSVVFKGSCNSASTFTRCVFKDNTPDTYTFDFSSKNNAPTFIDCEMNESTYQNKGYARFEDSSRANTGSIFGEGSPAMSVALLALIVSGVGICLTVYYNKKKAVPAAANNVAEGESKE